jgi:polysaccharide pyruvyl transferase WcaK-like protein
MKVAIWASCNHGNYGDDVMAIMFAKTVQKAGSEPYVYRLDAALSQKYQIKSANTIDELLQDASFSMIAGGSWLESRVLGTDYEQDFEEYLAGLEKHACPFYAISIGGDSNHSPDKLEPQRYKLFTHSLFQEATVRLTGDLEMMQKLNIKAQYFPDIVLSLSDFWKVDSKEKNPKSIKIGLNINHGHSRIYNWINNGLSKTHPNTTFYYIQSHLPNYKKTYEYQIDKERKNIKNFSYKDPTSFVQQISELDLMVSFKLHPGVTGIAYGIPFFLIDGLDKTKSFLKSIQVEQAICSYNKLLKIIAFKQVKQQKQNFDFNLIAQQHAESKKHFEFLEKLVHHYKQQ